MQPSNHPPPSGASTVGTTNAPQTDQQLSDGGGSIKKKWEEGRGCASDAISMHPARNGLARPRCNGAIPSSDSGMCSSAGLYLLHSAMLLVPQLYRGPLSHLVPGGPPMVSRDAPALLELYCPCQPACPARSTLGNITTLSQA